MSIDRIARAMTAGRPGAGFTERVMAPIHGRPRPDFTARVMERIDVARPSTVAQGFSPAFRAAFLLVPAALALAAGALVLRGARAEFPAVPSAPWLAGAPYDRGAIGAPSLPVDRWVAQAFRPASRARSPVRQAVTHALAAEPASQPIYMIDALEAPPDIAMKSIEPAACTIPALDGPAPLAIAGLKDSKEKS